MPQFEKRPCRPREHLEAAGRAYPSAWADIEHLRAGKGQGVDWPDWCFLPIGGVQAVVTKGAPMGNVNALLLRNPNLLTDAARLAALAPWRMTQGIYRFDPIVYDAVRDTPVDGDIPHEVLFRLPEWCVYIETPGLQCAGQALAGCFVHLEHDVNTGDAELRLLLDLETGPLIPLPLHLGQWSLAESIAKTDARALANAALNGVRFPSSGAGAYRPCIESIVSLLLYLCTQAGDISGPGVPGNPKPVRTRRGGWRLFPADRPTTWDVGARMGAALRRAYNAESGAQGPGASHAGPRPHIRRAHWHTILSGPRVRDGQPIPPNERRSELRWMPPIAVNVDSPDDLAPTVRTVT